MNAQSSRSHAIVQLNVEVSRKDIFGCCFGVFGLGHLPLFRTTLQCPLKIVRSVMYLIFLYI